MKNKPLGLTGLGKARGHVSLRVLVIAALVVLALFASFKLLSGWKTKALLAKAQGRNAVIAAEAVRKLGQSGYDSAVPTLERLLGEKPDPLLRVSIIEALGAIGDGESVETLAPFLQSPDATTVIKTAEALGRIGSSKAVAPLCEALSNAPARITTIWALGAIGDFAAYDSLSPFRDDSDPYVAYNAVQAIKKLGSGG